MMGVVGGVDSRVRGKKVIHPTLPLERTFCINCGKPKGWVSSETYSFIKVQSIVVICDACEAVMGRAPLEEAPIKEI